MNDYFIHTILRFLSKQKINVGICISGFIISLITVFIITIYINHELSYDQQEGAENIYRIVVHNKYSAGSENHAPLTLYQAKELLQDNIPEIESITRILPVHSSVNIKIGQNYFSEQALAYVDPEFFRIFSNSTVEGDPKELAAPYSLVITETTARKYFPAHSAIGQQLIIDRTPFKICAVIKDFTPNSHFRFNILGSLSSIHKSGLEQEGASFYTYLKAGNKIIPENLSLKIKPILKKLYEKHDQESGIERKTDFNLQPLLKIHLHSHLSYELEENGNITYIKICILVAFFILLISAINFANITTALSEKKIRFFSINKVVGATNNSINKLLGMEIGIMILISFILAFIIALLTGKWCLMHLSGIKIIYTPSLITELLVYFTSISITLFFIAFLFSFISFSKISLRSGFSGISHSGKKWNFVLYKTLLCIQIIVAITLIGCLSKTHNQLVYLKSKNLGFDKENILVFNNFSFDMQKKIPLIKAGLLKLPFVEKVTVSGELPGSRMPRGSCRLNENLKEMDCCLLRVDSNYISTLGIPLIEGTFFDSRKESIKNSMVINETAAKIISQGSALGKSIEFWGTEYIITGVVKDFHITSLHDIIPPLLFVNESSSFCDIAIRSRNLSNDNINTIKRIFKNNIPDYIPDYYWMSEKFDAMYKSEKQISHINWGLMIISIIITFMGVWSFASLFIGKKWKEMGVRKTFGANTKELIYILLKNFIHVITCSFILSIPLINIFVTYSDQQFAYKSDIIFSPYIISLAFITLIITGAICYHCHQITKLDAVEILKHD